MVVAADDGVMPQTREHLDILRYFGVRGGLTVLSKTDLVDRETIEIATMELQELLQGTVLQDRPIVEFSTKRPPATGSLIQTLKETIDGTPYDATEAPFRLWIDQVRQLTGIGTVVSGTVLSGSVREGDDLEILPAAAPCPGPYPGVPRTKDHEGVARPADRHQLAEDAAFGRRQRHGPGPPRIRSPEARCSMPPCTCGPAAKPL